MPQFRVRGRFANRQPLIVRVSAADAYEAVTQARSDIIESGNNPAMIVDIMVKKLDGAKSKVYVGQVPTGGSKRGRKTVTPAAAPAAEATPPAPAAAPAAPAAPVPAAAPARRAPAAAGSK